MSWVKLDSFDQLDKLLENSKNFVQVIYKHSSRCSISSVVMNRLQKITNNYNIYIIDVIAHRDISNGVAEKLNVRHQSPQLLLIEHGVCLYQASHMAISADELEKYLAAES